MSRGPEMQPPVYARKYHERMEELYGFGLFPLPPYRRAQFGDWRLDLYRGGISPGYATRTCHDPVRHVLLKGRQVWMSTGLMEMESHAWHVHQARGVVAVAGLGMGMYAYAVALKPEVEQVVVTDVSPDVVAVMRKATGFDGWPVRNKVTLIECDALSPEFAQAVSRVTGGRRPDYLYADIWPNYPNKDAAAQTAAMAERLDAAEAGWWGQEVIFGEALLADPAVSETMDPGYAAFCRDVAEVAGRGRRPFWRRLFNGLRSARPS